MNPTLRTLALLGALCASGTATADEGRRVALVVGVGTYAKLPAGLAVEAARSDAARVASALEQQGGFDRVRLLTDASVTAANLEGVLRDQVAQEVGPDDLFLLYFAGHGIGADFGDPRLLVYDTDPDALEQTSLGVKDLAARLQQWVHPGKWVVVTDAAFEGQFEGVALLGPTGNDWPSFGSHSFVISSAAPRQTARPGVFARAFTDGVSGKADANADGAVTASELNNWLVLAVPEATEGKQQPTVQGAYDPSVIVARPRSPEAARPPVVVAPAARLDKVKFVFQGGEAATVACAGDPEPRVCDPSCNAWDLPAGACKVTMRVNGADLAGTVDVHQRGAYTCRAAAGGLECAVVP